VAARKQKYHSRRPASRHDVFAGSMPFYASPKPVLSAVERRDKEERKETARIDSLPSDQCSAAITRRASVTTQASVLAHVAPAGSGGKSKRRLHRFVGELRVGVMVRYASDGGRLLRDVRPPTFVGGGLYVFLKSAQLVTRENLSTKNSCPRKRKTWRRPLTPC